MKIKQIGNRNFIFTYFDSPDWDLNLHVIIAEKNNYIVDPGIGSHTLNPMINFIRVRNNNPIIVINTHYHWDHVWANCLSGDVPIIAHASCLSAIEKDWETSIKHNKTYIKDDLVMKLPTITFERQLIFTEDQIILFHTPGHTPDSISVFDAIESVLNVGDNIGDTLDVIVPDLQCDLDIYSQSLMKYKALEPKIVISGHNQLLKKDVFDQITKEISLR